MASTSTSYDESYTEKKSTNVRMPTAAGLRSMSLSQVRLLRRTLASPMEFRFYPAFEERDAEQVLLGPPPEASPRGLTGSSETGLADDSGLFLLGSASSPFNQREERHYFLRYNYCRWRAARILEHYDGRRISAVGARDLLHWAGLVIETRSEIARTNLPLVVAMARRTRVTSVDFSELVSEGNMALLRAIDKFDCLRGFKFSTYACRAILKSFSRAATRLSRRRRLFPNEFDPELDRGDLAAGEEGDGDTAYLEELRLILGRNEARLSDVERTVIEARFALEDAHDGQPNSPKTLEQVGHAVGVTKERVRQIQNVALAKLRRTLERSASVA